ncbi:MAG: hypothetical protein ACFB0E_16375 [Leptolyngbyaceae cyanobacterium]
MKRLSLSLALGMSSLCWLTTTQSPASALRLRDCPGATWETQFRDCKMVDFHAPPPDEAAFEVSLQQSLSVVIAQYRTDFAIAHAPPRRAGLLVLQYETDSSPTWHLSRVQASQAP